MSNTSRVTNSRPTRASIFGRAARVLGATGSVAALAVAATAPDAWASNKDTTNVPDNVNHFVRTEASITSVQRAGLGSLHGSSELDRTGLVVDVNTTFHIDVTVRRETPSPSSLVGQWLCTTPSSGVSEANPCDLSVIRFNPSWVDNPLDHTEAAWKALGCHEVGHSGGITESSESGSCQNGLSWTTLTTHDISEVNSYPGW